MRFDELDRRVTEAAKRSHGAAAKQVLRVFGAFRDMFGVVAGGQLDRIVVEVDDPPTGDHRLVIVQRDALPIVSS